jgi:hypothetical protein
MTLTDTKGYYVLYFKNVAIGNQEITVRAKAEGALEKEIKFRIKEGKVINAIDFDFSQ